ncbi:hypothetical protein AAE478_001275 [Parahypoxylon ruwenzoriense]
MATNGTLDGGRTQKELLVPKADTCSRVDSSLYDFDPKSAQGMAKPYEDPEETTELGRRHHVFRFWPWELGSVFVAFSLVVATYAILLHFNGQRVPEWPFSINLNTLIALISTIMRSAMLVGVAEVISQTKWAWFSRPRPLSHFQYFDAASRSISGSIGLLFVAPTSLFGVLCALITVLSLGIGPFTQQAIKTVGCLQTHAGLNASLPLAHFVPGDGTYYRVASGVYELQIDMKGTMLNAIVNPTGNDLAIIPTCPTGNCTFARHDGITHSSIGMCSSCIDTTSLISGPGSEYYANYTLPNGMWISPASDMAHLNVGTDNLTWASSVFTAETASVAGLALANVTILSITTETCSNNGGILDCPIPKSFGGPLGFVATSFSLYPCLKNYNAMMERGILSERVVSTQTAPANRVEANISANSYSPYLNYTALQRPCFIDGEWYDLSNVSGVPQREGREFVSINVDGTNYTTPSECLYKMMQPYAYALSALMTSELFPGSCSYNARQGNAILCGRKWWLSGLYHNKKASFDTLRTAFDQFATAVTNRFRTTGSSNYDARVHEVLEGVVNKVTVCTVFQWQWLLMPTLLVIVTATIMVAVLMQNLHNHKQPVWKSSMLPLLYYGFGSHRGDPNLRPAMDLRLRRCYDSD